MMKHTNERPAFLPLLENILTKIIRRGSLTVMDWRGGISCFGIAGQEPSATIRFHDRWLPLRIALNPSLATGEAYMNGRLTVERGDLRSFLSVATADLKPLYDAAFMRACNQFAKGVMRALGGNKRQRAVLNVAHHYDLSADFYRLFLDEDMHYSCAYFPTGKETLEQAQVAKARHIAAKLCLKPGQSVLDIGSGWGSMALTLARETGSRVKGVTLSNTQLETARQRASQSGLADHANFEFQDYRDVEGRFDHIVSVGMLEHVGLKHLCAYFGQVAKLLARDGVALIHSIGVWDGNTGPDPWTDRYIFPGAHIPSLSEVMTAVEQSGLLVTDIEILKVHYAETLRHWSNRFAANRVTAREMYGEKFCRMWEFYLTSAEMSFRNRPLMVFQIQLAHRRDAVPLTRDYIANVEQQLAKADTPSIRQAA
jgi:cyclopropane-fatty-acyl-phospholipid synthase